MIRVSIGVPVNQDLNLAPWSPGRRSNVEISSSNDWKPSGDGGAGGREGAPNRSPNRWFSGERREGFWERVIWRPALRNVSEKFVIQLFLFLLARSFSVVSSSSSSSWFSEFSRRKRGKGESLNLNLVWRSRWIEEESFFFFFLYKGRLKLIVDLIFILY